LGLTIGKLVIPSLGGSKNLSQLPRFGYQKALEKTLVVYKNMGPSVSRCPLEKTL